MLMRSQFDTKLKELNINHYSMSDGQLERLQSFIDEFSGHEDFVKNQSMFVYLRADALANAGAHEEAIEVFNQLYKDETYIYPTLIAQRISEQLLLLNRENEALILLEGALKREIRPIDRLHLLFSAISNLDNPDSKLEQHSGQIHEISHFMGLVVPAKYNTFSAKITFLRNESNKANRRFNKMMIRNRHLPKQEQIEILKSYIEKEVIKEYRKFAEEALNRMQANNTTIPST
jgi:tetratricopeptide (TPR) repeat protein